MERAAIVSQRLLADVRLTELTADRKRQRVWKHLVFFPVSIQTTFAFTKPIGVGAGIYGLPSIEAYGRTLSATESATCSLVMTPSTSLAKGAPFPRTTTAIIAPRCHMRPITPNIISSSSPTLKSLLHTAKNRELPTHPPTPFD